MRKWIFSGFFLLVGLGSSLAQDSSLENGESVINAFIATYAKNEVDWKTEVSFTEDTNSIPPGKQLGYSGIIGYYTFKPKTWNMLTDSEKEQVMQDPRLKAFIIALRAPLPQYVNQIVEEPTTPAKPLPTPIPEVVSTGEPLKLIPVPVKTDKSETPKPTPIPTINVPKATPTPPKPTPKPEPKSTPKPSVEVPKPAATATPKPVVKAQPTPAPTATPKPIPTPAPTATPKPAPPIKVKIDPQDLTGSDAISIQLD